MREDETRRVAPKTRAPAAWLCLAIAVLGLARLPGFRVPMDQDTGCYAYIGRSWVHGRLPYRDVWDHKPPAIYLIPAALEAVGGSATPAALRACAVACGIGTLLLLYAIVRRTLGERTALAAAFVYAVAGSGVLVTRETFETEHPMVFFCLLAVWLMVLAARRWRWWLVLLAGVAGGVSVTFKPVAAPVLGLAFVWMVARQRRSGAWVRRAIAAVGLVGVGGVLVPAAFLVYFASAGILDDFVQAFRYNPVYRLADEYAGWGRDAGAILLSRARHLAPEQAWVVFLAAGGGLALLRRWREPGPWLAALWVAGAAIGMVAAGRFYPYYFLPLCAALAPLAGEALVGLWTGWRARPRPRWGEPRHTLLAIVLVGLAGLWAAHQVREHRVLTDPRHANVVLAAMAREIRQHTDRDACIFVWGTRQQVYALAGRRAPTRFIYDAPFRDPEAARAFFGQGVFDDIVRAVRSARCPYIVVTDIRVLERFPALRALLESDYEVVRDAESFQMTIRLYRHRAAPRGPGVEGMAT